jgi:hypothetical protein
MNLLIALFAGLLFFVLSPNVFLRLPKNGNKFTVAGVHAAVFALVLFLFQSLVFRTFGLREGNESRCGPGEMWDGTACVPEAFTDDHCLEGDAEGGEYMMNNEGTCVKRV